MAAKQKSKNPTKADKEQMYDLDLYAFEPPPVPTGKWDRAAWITWIDNHGKWDVAGYRRKKKTGDNPGKSSSLREHEVEVGGQRLGSIHMVAFDADDPYNWVAKVQTPKGDRKLTRRQVEEAGYGKSADKRGRFRYPTEASDAVKFYVRLSKQKPAKKRSSNLTTATDEQLAALRDYAEWAGGNWRRMLTGDWLRGGSDWHERRDRWHFLQQLRNQQGPSKLDKLAIDAGIEKPRAKKKTKGKAAAAVSMAEIKRRHRGRENPRADWFGKGEMRFFGTKLHGSGIQKGKNVYFVASHQVEWRDPRTGEYHSGDRFYTIHFLEPEGNVNTYGGPRATGGGYGAEDSFPTEAEARDHIKTGIEK